MNKPLHNMNDLVHQSWKKIAPFWPLKNLIAVNPLQGLQDLPIEEALMQGAVFFQQKEMPKQIELINRLTIKWMQAFFDEGQATIGMPLRDQGLYASWKKLACFDDQIHGFDQNKKEWLLQLPNSSDDAIAMCFAILNIPEDKQLIFLTLMLTTLPGWASHIKYRAEWSATESNQFAVSETDYTAIRIILTTVFWLDAIELIAWYESVKNYEMQKLNPIKKIEEAEDRYLAKLLNELMLQQNANVIALDAQIVFCIDVRSEPFRKALESVGNYETFGFAGFFGIPVSIKNTTTQELYASCPVLLKPQNIVYESPSSKESCQDDSAGYKKIKQYKFLYQSLKYNFTTSFVLVELAGFPLAIWMSLRSFVPNIAIKFRDIIVNFIRPQVTLIPSLSDISFSDQLAYAQGALKGMGLTKNFAPIVVFCGHGSSTQNNAYATILDCGACAGRHGGSNARILATILQDKKIREHLNQSGIVIPDSTSFIAGEHNTTTDQVELYQSDFYDTIIHEKIKSLKIDLVQAGKINSQKRSKNMDIVGDLTSCAKQTKTRSVDWSQVRPEWGLARNASFIIGPRSMSKKIDLEGRAFLHSYDYTQDQDGAVLHLILTAPMIVAQWINAQYLFSTLDVVAYGSGSKVTKNITGKMGIMQGNASDLMTGLPLQSVYKNDTTAYHEPVRLMTIVYAPLMLIDKIIEQEVELQKLFKNGWVLLVCIDPNNIHHAYYLHRDLTWKKKK